MLSIPMNNSFDQLLTAARERRGMTQAELSDASGLTLSHISHLEQGLALPTLDTMGELAVGLKMTVSELVDGLDEEYLAS
jgi:transcriptional regulator with XRE-family HTH domain